MLFAGVIFVVIWRLFFEYMIFHSAEWARKVDRLHELRRPYGLSYAWMQRLEKGSYLKIIVGLTTFISLVCLAFVMVHGHAIRVN